MRRLARVVLVSMALAGSAGASDKSVDQLVDEVHAEREHQREQIVAVGAIVLIAAVLFAGPIARWFRRRISGE